MEAFLILENGTVFRGISVGAKKEVISEIVFNTSMTGYLEVLTDPSYAGQSVVMTYPLIGNYGICYADTESRLPWLDGFIAREFSRMPSNFRSQNTIQNFMKKYNVAGISGIDTRALTRMLRDKGTMNGMITTKRYRDEDMPELLERIKAYRVTGVVKRTSATEVYEEQAQNPDGTRYSGEKEPKRVALLDVGAKRGIIRELQKRGCDVTVYPSDTAADMILASNPDGILISNGPGDPKENTEIIKEIKKLYDSDVPIFAICLGHQLMALATGADTYKLKYGHRGGNHPVKDIRTGKVFITTQNHGYAVDTSTLDPKIAREALYNVNDRTNEGLEYVGKKILTVQYHPEACPGPRDSSYLFDEFVKMMEG
ncbi:MAG: carbamoyl phosphate synthase small subunit [Eubacterium sp.]